MYLTALRPDIMFAVSACLRHQVTPPTSHLNAVKKIFKYLKGQPNLAAGSDAPAGAAAGGDAADEANVVANDAIGGAAEAPPTGYVDPDDIEPIFFGPQPRPMDYVEPDFEVPIFFSPQPRPDNYVEPKEPNVIISMEDDTIHGGFHVESPVRFNDATKPTVDAAGRAEDPSMLTILSDKLDRCMGRIA
nr:putative ribonuclease H-like domain-containing protein [Tanacetum cinerariifolium]